MAISMKTDQTYALLKGMFPASSTEITNLNTILHLGGTVQLGLFTVTVKYAAQVWEGKSPALVAKYMTATDNEKTLIRSMVSNVLAAVVHDAALDTTLAGIVSPPTTIAPPPLDQQYTTLHIPPKGANTTAKPGVGVPVTLKKASYLGQKIKGTSPTSQYVVVALGKVNVAVRITPDKVSVRGEFQNGRDEDMATNMVALGFSDYKSYLSIHVGLPTGVPAERVVGSLLWSIGCQFTDIATTKKDMV